MRGRSVRPVCSCTTEPLFLFPIFFDSQGRKRRIQEWNRLLVRDRSNFPCRVRTNRRSFQLRSGQPHPLPLRQHNESDQKLHELGQSLWLDNITRDLLNSGTLDATSTSSR